MARSNNRYRYRDSACIFYSLTLLGNLLLGEAAQLSYSDHCSSYVTEAAPDVYAQEPTSSPLTEFHTGYYQGAGAGSSRAFNNNNNNTLSSFSFLTRQVLKTDRDGVLKIAAELIFKLASDGISLFSDSVAFTVIRNDSLRRRRPSWVSFRMEGFWDESSGRVCMVGSSYSRGGEEDLKLKAVLNLDNVNSSATITSLFTGTFHVQKKKDQHFDAISIFIFPNMNYKYSLLVPDQEIGIDHLPAGLEPPDGKFCAFFETLVYEFSLTYPPDCSATTNYNCSSPFETQSLPPNTMLFNAIGCSDRKELRVLLQFSNQSGDWSYDPNTTMIGEGLWDKKKNQVHIIACRVSMSSFSSAAAAVVNDCLIRLQFSFPAMWSIRDRNTLVGKIKKTHSDGDFGNSITARSTSNYVSVFPNLNYEYTEGKRVEKFCLDVKKDIFSDNVDVESNAIYPNWSSPDLSFDFYVEDLDGKRIGSGFGYPLFVGKEMYERSAYDIPLYESRQHSSSSNSGKNTQFNISYSITISSLSDAKHSNKSLRGGQISAEGVYNVETGSLCLVGCRNLVGDSWDCEIGILIQFARRRRGLKGSMESTREISDPLYFKSVTFSMEVASRAWVWRMHFELCLVLISNTLSCIFTALLFFHVRKHPQEAVSVMMIAILALGHAVPLLLNASSRYLVSVFLEAGKWLEVTEVMGKVVTVMTLFLELCLLQLSIFSTRLCWVAEKKAFFFAMPVYCVGAFLCQQPFGGVVVDGFLLPQILVNIFSEKLILMPGAFYFGTTLLRLLPHIYDLWRRRRRGFEGPYVYAVPDMDLYSSGWDLIIVLGGIVLAVIIYLQQRFGGQVIVPRRFRARGNNYLAAPPPTYDKVPQEMTDL